LADTRPPASPDRLGAAARVSAALALIALFAMAGPPLLAGESNLSVEFGVAHDDNPFETPSDPYFDQFDEVTVDPEKRSGFFVPFTLDGDYLVPNEKHQFVLDYRLRHHAYGSGNSNADETYLRIAPGYQLVTRRIGAREDLFFAVPFLRYRKEIYFDRDTGVGEIIGIEDASKRYTYLASGGDIGFSSRVSRTIKWEVAGGYERRNYEDVPSLSSLDQDRFQIRSELELGISRRLKLYLDHTYRILDYDDRPSRDRDGGFATGADPVRYSYQIAGATLRFKPLPPWTFYFDLDYTGRRDEFAGYNDYHDFGGRVRSIWTDGRTRVRGALRFQQRDYPTAFVFDKEVNPDTGRANPNKAYDIFDASVLVETALAGDWSFLAEVTTRRQEAADPRFTYHELQISVGVKWEFESLIE